MPAPIKVEKGDRYGRFVILFEVEQRNKQRRFMCLCDCGTEKEIALVLLRNGQTKSCGCFKRDHLISMITKHGRSPRGKRNKLQAVWVSMKQRCLNDKNDAYKYYGGRGITIHTGWLEFENFESWAVKSGYEEGLSIERIDVNGNYDPFNCTWIPRSEQSNNTRRSTSYEFNGKKQSLKDWSLELGINYSTLTGRLRRGWTVERAFTQSVDKKRSHRRSRDV